MKTFEQMHKSAVKIMLVVITVFKGKFNLGNAHNTIGSCNFVEVASLCSVGIQLADYISKNTYIVECLLCVSQTFILPFFLVCYSNICNRLLHANALAYRAQSSPNV